MLIFLAKSTTKYKLSNLPQWNSEYNFLKASKEKLALSDYFNNC